MKRAIYDCCKWSVVSLIAGSPLFPVYHSWPGLRRACRVRKSDAESRARRNVGGTHLSTVRLDDGFNDRQSQPITGIAGRITPAMEAAKQLRQIIFRNTDARILYAQLDHARVLLQPDRDGAALRREFDRVIEEIADRAAELRRVAARVTR